VDVLAGSESVGSGGLTGPLYHTDRIYRFQVEGVARAYMRRNNLAVWSTGLGKTHLALAQSALLAEDGMIDHIVVVCESNKLREWLGDFRTFCRYSTHELYMGSGRHKLLGDLPQVMITTYETARNDAASKVKGKPRAMVPGPLTLALENKKTLFIYDEASKFKNRDSGIYRCHEYMLNHLRRNGDVRVTALTATPLESSPENVFNIGRIVSPGFLTVANFEREYVKGRDEWGRAYGYVNIGEHDRRYPDSVTLFERMEPFVMVKDKHDADVVAEFPRQVESFELVELPKPLATFIEMLEDLDKNMAHNGPMVVRQALGHPMALLSSNADAAKSIVASYGVEALAKLPAPKLDALEAKLDHLVREEGRKTVVFSFFGQSVLPILVDRLRALGYHVVTVHGAMSSAEQERQITEFRRGNAQVLVSSDAGSKGINLPEATAVINYDLPWLASTYEQRINRVSRITSDAEMVLAHSLIAKGTVEEKMAQILLERNSWFDSFVARAIAGGEMINRPTAEERRLLLRMAGAEQIS